MTMFINPDDIINYTSFDDVKNRNTDLLSFDIISAQEEVFQMIAHRFDDTTKYPTLPTQARLGYILLAEANALTAMDDSFVKGYQSESFGNGAYSYQVAKGSAAMDRPKILALFKPFIDPIAKQAMQTAQATITPIKMKFLTL